jgi:hypothetical protein
MGVEIVLHTHNSGGVGQVGVGRVLQRMGVIDGRRTVGGLVPDFALAPAAGLPYMTANDIS